MGRPAPLAALATVDALGEAEVLSATGAEGVQSLNKK
jgi:hypothetical protein